MDNEWSLDRCISIWCNGTMSARPGYYSGGGVNSGDFGPRHMEAIYNGMKRDVSPEAAGRFVDFIERLTDLSATSFLVAFQRFIVDGFEDRGLKQGPADGLTLSGYGKDLEGEAFGAILSVLGGMTSSPYQTESDSRRLARPFLLKHGRQVDLYGRSLSYGG